MILKHRDREILRFEWLEPYGVHIVSVNEAELKFLPQQRAYIFNFLSNIGLKPDDVPIFDNGYGLFALALDRARDSNDDTVLQNIKADPFIAAGEMAGILGVGLATVKRRLGKLQQEGRIKRVGSDKTGHWEVL